MSPLRRELQQVAAKWLWAAVCIQNSVIHRFFDNGILLILLHTDARSKAVLLNDILPWLQLWCCIKENPRLPPRVFKLNWSDVLCDVPRLVLAGRVDGHIDRGVAARDQIVGNEPVFEFLAAEVG
jgi:hypothetical protein